VAKKGRPRLGGDKRAERILVCLEASLRTDIEGLAKESRRSLSDYCRYVLEQHVLAVKEEEPEEPVTYDPIEESEMEEMKAPEPEEEEEFKCGICYRSFDGCECAANGYR